MTRFSIRILPGQLQQDGPCIKIRISAAEDDVSEAESLGLEYRTLEVSALIDTAASRTVINPQVADTCKLKHTSFQYVSAAGSEPRLYREYAATISFPDSGLASLRLMPVIACPLTKQPISCLLGRDILPRWKLAYDGPDGEFSVSD